MGMDGTTSMELDWRQTSGVYGWSTEYRALLVDVGGMYEVYREINVPDTIHT